MGEIADAILDGKFDEITGEYLGEGCGYPRSLHYDRCGNKSSAAFGVQNYLTKLGKNLSKQTKRGLVKEYSQEVLGLNYELIGFDKCCIEIQKNFNKFAQFVRNKLNIKI